MATTQTLHRALRRLSNSSGTGSAQSMRRFASDAMPPQPPVADAPVAAATKNIGAAVRKKKQSRDSRFVTVGLPLLLFVAGGYIALTQFVGGKFEARDHMIKSNTTREFDLEEEHKKMTKKLVLDDFELKPVPKPNEPTR